MPQQEATSQELTAGGGGGTTSGGTSFTTGQVCTVSGTYVSENRYLRSILPLAAGDAVPAGLDGKKTTWTALTTAIATASKTSDGGFTTVKVEAGAV